MERERERERERDGESERERQRGGGEEERKSIIHFLNEPSLIFIHKLKVIQCSNSHGTCIQYMYVRMYLVFHFLNFGFESGHNSVWRQSLLQLVQGLEVLGHLSIHGVWLDLLKWTLRGKKKKKCSD